MDPAGRGTRAPKAGSGRGTWVRRGATFLGLVLVGGGWAGGAEATALQALQWVRESAAAAEAGDAAGRLAKLEAAAELRPDFPQVLLDLAEAQVAADQPEAAVATLRRFAGLGRYAPIEQTAGFAALRARADFKDVVRSLAGNLHPRGDGKIAFTLRDVTGLIAGLAWREKTGEFYFADGQARCVWARNQDGVLRRFAGEGDELPGVLALAIDEAGGTMWAAGGAIPAMRGFAAGQEGTAALVELDLETGAVRRTIGVEREAGEEGPHGFHTLAIAEDGGVIVADREGRRLWRLAPGAAGLAVAAESDEFFAPHGLALLPGELAVVADQVNGLLRVDLRRGTVARLEPPAGATFVDFTCLVATPEGALLAAQSGLRPNRLWRIELDPAAEVVTRVVVLESGHLAMSAPALGCLGPEGDFYLIGNAGWSRFDLGDGQPSAPRPVPIFRTKPDGPGR